VNNAVPCSANRSPQVELHFGTFERAHQAAALLANSEFGPSKVSLSEVLFEDGGRLLVLKFTSFGARPSELLSFVQSVVEVASVAGPIRRSVSIPLV